MKTLKILLVTLLMLFGFASVSVAATATWQQDLLNEDGTVLTDLAGWNVYETTSGRVKINSTPIPVTSCTGTTTLSCSWSVPPGVATKGNTFVATAVDALGNESIDSNTATYVVKPVNPKNMGVHK